MAKITNTSNQKTFTFSKYASIGRASRSSLSIKDRKLSRLHCEIIKIDSKFILVDLYSQNGTLLNDKIAMESILQDRDVITVGKSQVVFYLDFDEQENNIRDCASIKDFEFSKQI